MKASRVVRRAVRALASLAAAMAVIWGAPEAIARGPLSLRLKPMQIWIARDSNPACASSCAEWIAAEGKIEVGTRFGFIRILQSLGSRRLPILIDSGGGSVEDAMAIGREIRARHLDVVVTQTIADACAPGVGACSHEPTDRSQGAHVLGAGSVCASACTLILAAGTRRAAAPWTRVGVHRIVQNGTEVRKQELFRTVIRSINGMPVETRTLIGEKTISTEHLTIDVSKAYYSRVASYLTEMGIKPSLLPLMLATAPTSIHWLSQDEASATALVTDLFDGSSLIRHSDVPWPAAPEPGFVRVATSELDQAMLVDPGGDAVKTQTTGGRVKWTLDRSMPSSKEDGVRTVLGATIDIPAAQFSVVMRIAPDRANGSLVADMTFKMAKGSIRKIERLWSLQMRSDVSKKWEFVSDLMQSSGPTSYRTKILPTATAISGLDSSPTNSWFVVPMLADGMRFIDLKFAYAAAVPLLTQARDAWRVETSRTQARVMPVSALSH